MRHDQLFSLSFLNSGAPLGCVSVCDFICSLVGIFVGWHANSCAHRFATTIFNYKSKCTHTLPFCSLSPSPLFSLLFHSADRLFPQFHILTTLLHFGIGRKRDTFLWWKKKKLWFRLDLVHLNTINVVVLGSQQRKKSMDKMCLIWNRHDIGWANKSKEYATKAEAKWEKNHAPQPASQPSTFYTYYIVIAPNGFLFRNTPISLAAIHSL